MRTLELSPNCTLSQFKANTGKNIQCYLYSGIGAMTNRDNNINARINRKSFFANPLDFYKEINQK